MVNNIFDFCKTINILLLFRELFSEILIPISFCPIDIDQPNPLTLHNQIKKPHNDLSHGKSPFEKLIFSQ